MTSDDLDIPVLTNVIDSPPVPVLTDVIDSPAVAASMHAPLPSSSLMLTEEWQQALCERLIAELTLQLPVLVESALREYLPQAMGARLQAELLGALANALPLAAQTAARELSREAAYEVGRLLEPRLQDDVRRAVAEEIRNLSSQQS